MKELNFYLIFVTNIFNFLISVAKLIIIVRRLRQNKKAKSSSDLAK